MLTNLVEKKSNEKEFIELLRAVKSEDRRRVLSDLRDISKSFVRPKM